jgi:hypothetical protein
MLLTSKQLKRLMNEIRTEDIEVDQANDAVLKRWEDDDNAIDALRDILARVEKANGSISTLDVAAFIQFVLTIKWYAEKTDRGFAELLKIQRKKTVFCRKRSVGSQELLGRIRSHLRTLIRDTPTSTRLMPMMVLSHQSAAAGKAHGFEPYFCGSYPTQCTRTPAASGWILRWRQSPAWCLIARLMLSTSETLGDPSAPHLAVHSFRNFESSAP